MKKIFVELEKLKVIRTNMEDGNRVAAIAGKEIGHIEKGSNHVTQHQITQPVDDDDGGKREGLHRVRANRDTAQPDGSPG